MIVFKEVVEKGNGIVAVFDILGYKSVLRNNDTATCAGLISGILRKGVSHFLSWVFTWLNMGRQVVVGRAFHRLLA